MTPSNPDGSQPRGVWSVAAHPSTRPTLRGLVLALGMVLIASLATADDSATATTASAVEGIPVIEFASEEHAARYAKGVELLEQGEYKKAAAEFRKLKSKVPAGVERDGVTKAHLEAQGGVELEKALGYAKKLRFRKALAVLDKVLPKYTETAIGEQLAFHRQSIWAEIYVHIASFEEKSGTDGDDESGDADENENAGRRGGNGRGGESGYGANTTVLSKEDDKDKVREGENSLMWMTGKELAAISFEDLPATLSEYRYLNISIRSEGDTRPQILLLFDALDWRGGGGGGGRRGGARRGAAWVFQRDGFSMAITPKGKWQDLRLDLKKFTKKGTASWSGLKALRLVHIPGISAQLYVDDIRLEKE